jgi:hypothetical protein
MPALLSLAALTLPIAVACGQDLQAFSYPDTEAARAHWEPQFGSGPVRVEKLDDGTTCLVLEADFKADKERACWDWIAPLDLSKVGRIAFEMSGTGRDLIGTAMVYFGTPGGWYARGFGAGGGEEWTRQALALDTFTTEDKPDGWDKVTRFRFSVWSNGAGKLSLRLRNLRALPADPAESLLKNGSFEISGVGVPYGWGSGHWGVGSLPWATHMDLWRERFRVDDSVAKDGAHSLLLYNTPDLPLLKAQSVWFTPPKSAGPLVLSAWLRSDQTGLPVTLSCGNRSAQAEVGTEWRQASVSGIEDAERVIVTIAPQAPGKLWIDAVQVQKGDAPTADYHPAFGDQAIAARERLVDWSPPRRTADIAAGRSITGPTQPAEAAIDAHGRFLLDGKPYIQHSLGLEFVSDLDILNFAAESGFRDVCVQVQPNVTTDELQAIFDRCAEVGLRIIPWLDGRMTREQFTQHIRTLKDHPALLAWYVYDEPSGERFAEAEARYGIAKALDPTRPALINYLSNKLEGHMGDIYSTDVYPIPHSTPMAAIGAVQRMEAAAAPEHKPVWMWLQGTGYAYWMDREPTPRELSCMVYGSLLEGARGLYYFAQIPRTKQCWDEMRAVLVEVDALTPALTSLDAAPTLTCDSPDVLCRAYSSEGSMWVVSVNTRPTPCRPTFALEGSTGPVNVPFEGREVRAEAGRWTDDFGPYERHVYRLRG